MGKRLEVGDGRMWVEFQVLEIRPCPAEQIGSEELSRSRVNHRNCR